MQLWSNQQLWRLGAYLALKDEAGPPLSSPMDSLKDISPSLGGIKEGSSTLSAKKTSCPKRHESA